MKRRYEIEKQRAVNEFRQLGRQQKPEHPDDPVDGRHCRPAAARRRAPAERGWIGSDKPGNARGRAPFGRRSTSATCRSASASLGPGGQDGRKTVLPAARRATENATVMGALLSDLVQRGLDFSTPRLYVVMRHDLFPRQPHAILRPVPQILVDLAH